MKKIFLGIGLFCLFGSFVMLTEKDIGGTIGYLLIGIVFLALCKNYILELYNKNKHNFSKEAIQENKSKIISNMKLEIEKQLKIKSSTNANVENTNKEVNSQNLLTNKMDELYETEVPREVYTNAYISRKQSKIVRNYVVFDTETTGLDPSVEKIIEISAIKYINNEKVDEFSCLVNPEVEIKPFITKLTGITQSDLIEKPTIDQIIPKFYEFIEDYTLVAHNAPYDIKMLACEAYRSNIPLCKNKIIDTIPLAKKTISKDKIENYKLETLKKYMGLNNKSHRALDDCETCARIYQLYLADTQKSKIIDKKSEKIIVKIN